MTKSKRLKPVSDIAAANEQEAARNMGQQQRLLDEYRLKLQELHQYRAEYAQRMMQAGSSGIGAGQMQDYASFIRRLDEAIAFQNSQIEHATRQLEIRQREWRAMHSRSEALNKVVNRYQASENRERDRREQNELDERAQHARPLYRDL